MMHPLREEENGVFFVDHPSEFRANGYVSEEDLAECVDFAYSMTFGRQGEHRDHRSGGQARRRMGEIFTDTFQGKIAEFAFYHLFSCSKAEITRTDLDVMGLGKWDTVDFTVAGSRIAIKSTKYFGQLLLLETKDWTSEGRYIPDGGGCPLYDYIVLIRVKPELRGIFKEKRWLYSDCVDKSDISDLVSSADWEINLAGYCTLDELVSEVIGAGHILPRGSKLNGKTPMDAENYYIQAGDLHPMSGLISQIRSQ